GVGCTFHRSIAVRRLTTFDRGGATALIGTRKGGICVSIYACLYVLPKLHHFGWYNNQTNEKLTWQTTRSPEDMALRSTSPQMQCRYHHLRNRPIRYQAIKQKADGKSGNIWP
ncbi:unnamed protein product, partial [Musa hybrid cultivar]